MAVAFVFPGQGSQSVGMLAALASAGRTVDEVGFVSLHGTATVFNDLMEDKAMRLAFGARVR